MAILEFERVTMLATAGIVEILKEISLNVELGDFIALVGPSGAGKTSLLRLMNRLNEASSGQIWFEGNDIRKLPPVGLRRSVALVNQESRLLGMSVRETLGYPLRLQGKGEEAIAARIEDWTKRLNIPSDWMDRTEVNLSVGQRQRVAIARTLIAEPQILLLDEPTSSQDVGYSEFLLSFLAERTAQKKLAVIMSNHQVELLGRHVNRLWHLEDGRLIADVPAEQVHWERLRQRLMDAERKAQEDWS